MFRAALRLPRVEGNLYMHPGGTKVLTCIGTSEKGRMTLSAKTAYTLFGRDKSETSQDPM